MAGQMRSARMTRRRDRHQRIAYAARRASLAVDRMIRATNQQEKDRAASWAQAWGRRAGYGGSR